MRQRENYVDNKKLQAAMEKYKASLDRAEVDNEEPPQVPEYIAICIMQIADGLATKSNFAMYPFIEDMKMDGITNCLQYIGNYNPDKYSNPFAYFTRIIYFAFIRRIKKEKKVLYTKYKVIQKTALFDTDPELMNRKDSPYSEYSKDYMNDFIRDYEKND